MNKIIKGNNMTKQKGFTLIELMLVMLIIGVLASIGIGTYTEYVTKSRLNALLGEMIGSRTHFAINVQFNEDDYCHGVGFNCEEDSSSVYKLTNSNTDYNLSVELFADISEPAIINFSCIFYENGVEKDINASCQQN